MDRGLETRQNSVSWHSALDKLWDGTCALAQYSHMSYTGDVSRGEQVGVCAKCQRITQNPGEIEFGKENLDLDRLSRLLILWIHG